MPLKIVVRLPSIITTVMPLKYWIYSTIMFSVRGPLWVYLSEQVDGQFKIKDDGSYLCVRLFSYGAHGVDTHLYPNPRCVQ